MLISVSTPMRISFFGGSTDHPEFIKKYQKSLIISMKINLNTHIFLAKDKYGFNSNENLYQINYSRKEKVKEINDIKNDIAREVLKFFDMPPINIYLFSDIYSKGNGLASSSSYVLSLMQACLKFLNISKPQDFLYKNALKIERKFNKYCGYQDTIGCLGSSLKIIKSKDDNKYNIQNIDPSFLDDYNMFLIPTNIYRNSHKVLNKISHSIDKILPIYDMARRAEKYLINKQYNEFIDLINESWYLKKKSNPIITKNNKIKEIDQFLSSNKQILARRLVGAGNGGFFFAITKKNILNKKPIFNKAIRINYV